MARREELLAEARRQRIRWVSEAGDDTCAPQRGEAQLWHSEAARELPSLRPVFSLLSALVGELEEDAHFDLPGEVLLMADAPVPEQDGTRSPYAVFLERLKHPSAADVVKTLQTFVQGFRLEDLIGFRSEEDSHEEVVDVRITPVANALHTFVAQTAAAMRDHRLWAREDDAEFAETRECLEKFVSTKLYGAIYCPTPMQVEQDRQFAARLVSLQFLGQRHFDLAEAISDAALDHAAEALRGMEGRRCARDKISCIIEMNRRIQALLAEAKDGAAGGHGASADDILPVLILVVKRAAPPALQSQLQFIQEFRHPDRLLSEAGYVLTCLLSAVHFLQTVKADQLTIEKSEFDSLMAQCQRDLKGDKDALKALRDLEARRADAAAATLGHDWQEGASSPSSSAAAAPPSSGGDGAAEEPEAVLPSELLRQRRLHERRERPAASAAAPKRPAWEGTPTAGGGRRSVRGVLREAKALLGGLRYAGAEGDTVRVADVPRILAENRALAQALNELSGKVESLLSTARRSSAARTPQRSSSLASPL